MIIHENFLTRLIFRPRQIRSELTRDAAEISNLKHLNDANKVERAYYQYANSPNVDPTIAQALRNNYRDILRKTNLSQADKMHNTEFLNDPRFKNLKPDSVQSDFQAARAENLDKVHELNQHRHALKDELSQIQHDRIKAAVGTTAIGGLGTAGYYASQPTDLSGYHGFMSKDSAPLALHADSGDPDGLNPMFIGAPIALAATGLGAYGAYKYRDQIKEKFNKGVNKIGELFRH